MKEEVAQAQGQAIEALERDPHGYLPFRNRVLLWISLGPRLRTDDDKYAIDGVGLRRRFFLARQCAMRVLPIWEEFFNAEKMLPIWKIESHDDVQFRDDIPSRMVETADVVIKNRQKLEEGKKCAEDGWLYADNVGVIIWDYKCCTSADSVIRAAHACLATALFDEFFNELNPDDAIYLSRDPYTFDAAEFACAAVAGGFPLNMARSKEFWTWYLNVAFPMAEKVD